MVEGLGGFWDAFPYILLIYSIFMRFGPRFLDVPLHLALALFVGNLVLVGLFLVWCIFDVLHRSAAWWWILIAFFCFPIGWWIYTAKGREGG